jgi:exosome complex protein LRP1
MSDDTLKIRRKISTLTRSLDDLETSLAALSSQSLPDLVIGLDTIQQAKLQVVIPYLVYDLVFGPSYKNSPFVSPSRSSIHRHVL